MAADLSWPKGYSTHHAQKLRKKMNKKPAETVSQSSFYLDGLGIGLLLGDGEGLPLYQLSFFFPYWIQLSLP